MHLTSPTRRPAGATRPSAYLLAAAAGAAAGLIRLIPFGYRPPNCTPLGAVGLFGGGRLPGWFAALLPPAVLAASDALLWAWYCTPRTSAWIYAAFVAYVQVGHWLARA